MAAGCPKLAPVPNLHRRGHLAVLHLELHDRMLGVLDIRIVGTTLSVRAVFGIHGRRLFPSRRASAACSTHHQELPFPLPALLPAADIPWEAKFNSNYQRIFNANVLDPRDLHNGSQGLA